VNSVHFRRAYVGAVSAAVVVGLFLVVGQLATGSFRLGVFDVLVSALLWAAVTWPVVLLISWIVGPRGTTEQRVRAAAFSEASRRQRNLDLASNSLPTVDPVPQPIGAIAQPALVAPSPEPVGSASKSAETLALIAQLAALRDSGAITEDQFHAKRDELLRRI
jgi:hypothetical protein